MAARGCRLAPALVLAGVVLQGAPALAESVDPVKVATGASGNLYVVSFKGRYNVRSAGSWVGEKTVPSLSGAPVGHMAVSCSSSVCCVAWEEGAGVIAPNDNIADRFDIVFATISPDGTVGDGEHFVDSP